MSYVRAKQLFKDAQRAIKSNPDPALSAVVDGLLQLTQSLEKHIAELHAEIVFVRKQIGGERVRGRRSASGTH